MSRLCERTTLLDIAILMFRPLELLPSPPMERASFFDDDDNNEDDDPIITAPSSLSPSLEKGSVNGSGKLPQKREKGSATPANPSSSALRGANTSASQLGSVEVRKAL